MPLLLALLALLHGAEPEVTAFVDVNVVPMDRERVLEHQTVLVRGGRIERIGPAAEVVVPEGAMRVDGAGRWLLPGLFDMHAHFLCDFGFLPEDRIEDEMFLMLGNGITTARLMIGRPEHLRWKREIADGSRLGPRLFVASPQFSGRRYGDPYFHGMEVPTPEAAAAAVRQCQKDGYDAIKMTLFITPPIYDAVTAAAREAGIRVVGHVGHQVGLERAIAAGQQVEHLDEYLEMLLPPDSSTRTSVSDVSVWDPRAWPSVDLLDAERIPGLAERVVQAGVWNTPTLFYMEFFGAPRSKEEIESWPWFRFFPPAYVQRFEGARLRFLEVQPKPERAARYVALRRGIVKALWERGGRLMIGSDAPELFCLYGFAVHEEMQTFVAAGLTPYAALEAATRNPAEWLGVLAESGTVAEGKRADLILSASNPLADLRSLEQPVGVMVRGRWLPQAEIAARFDAIATATQEQG